MKTQRRKERDRKAAQLDLVKRVRLRAEGKSCSSCAHFKSFVAGLDKPICELGSGFDGYQITKPNNICTAWEVTC